LVEKKRIFIAQTRKRRFERTSQSNLLSYLRPFRHARQSLDFIQTYEHATECYLQSQSCNKKSQLRCSRRDSTTGIYTFITVFLPSVGQTGASNLEVANTDDHDGIVHDALTAAEIACCAFPR
jgi:hypothetical protein